MIELLRTLAAAVFRFADGSALEYPRIITVVLTALASGWAAWDASSDWGASIIVGLCSAGTIQAGYTNWTDLKHQALRGLLPCTLMTTLLTAWGHVLSPLSILLICGAHTTAFISYYGIDKIKPPVGHWEQFCRVTQGGLICFAASLI